MLLLTLVRSCFYLGNPISAFLLLRRVRKILTITLTDLHFNVIFSCSSGSIDANKRFRRSAYVMEPLFKKLLVYLKYYNINFLKLILRMRVNGQIYSLLTECASNNIGITHIINRLSRAHNGVRSKIKARR